MTEQYVRRKTVDTFFIHNVFGSFFSGVLNWFSDEFYPRFNYKVIGTYDKSLKYFIDKKQMGVDPSDKILPAISLDPMLDFSQEERGGKFLWQHSGYAPGMGMYMFKGINLKEQDVLINPVFSRYSGTFEVTFWLTSVYELLDFRVALLQFSGGFNRWLRPQFFWTSLILPEAIQNFETDSETHTKIDWSNTTGDLISVDSINKHKLGIPIALDPIWRLTSFGDSSQKYGGDQVAEFKLSASFEYEINIPTYIVLSRGLDPTLSLSFSIGNTYTKYPLVSPFKILQVMSEIDSTQKYFDKNFKYFSVSNQDEIDHLLVKFGSNTVSNPSEFTKYDYIVNGTLVNYNDINIEVHKNTILYFDSYRAEFLPALRKCAGVISRNDTQTSLLYSKCLSLQKPLIAHITDAENTIVRSQLSLPITLDSLSRKLYSGILEHGEVTQDEKILGFDVVKDIQRKDPDLYNEAIKVINKTDITANLPEHMGGPEDVAKMQRRLLKDDCNGIQTRFYLGYILDDAHKDNLLVYVDNSMLRQGSDYTLESNSIIVFTIPPPRYSSVYIGGHLLVIRDSKLISIYEFTEIDEQDLSRKIIVDLPEKLLRQEDMVLISYIGRMEYERDYTVDIAAQTATILLKPKNGEIVQFFYYVSTW